MKFAFIPALIFTAGSAFADPVGLRLQSIEMPHHGAPSEAAIFYPNGGGGAATRFAENPVFQGVPVMQGAEIEAGQHPVILMSHGMGGGIQSTAWLAAGLAERGAVVIGVNHRNSTWSAFDMTQGIKHWTRAQDLRRALDTLLADPAFDGRLDTSRIMAAGFSFGGWSALSLGGAQANHAGLLDVCEAMTADIVYCDEFLSDAIGLADQDPEQWNASYADPRITHVAAIDPGFVWGLTPSDLSAVAENTLLIQMGSGEDRMLATDIEASGFAAFLPSAEVKIIDPAIHFTAMPLCTPAGAKILEAEKDDPVCTDPEGTNRAAVHKEIIDAMAGMLGL